MAPSPTIRRLLKETSELSASSSNPNPTFHAAPVSDSNLHEWHFTLLGPPPPSPYAGGLYHGRISLPTTYPLKPPNFRFLTPSGRFEVNREICLSISGFHEETWMPAWGVRTALTALRSFMAEKGTAGQVGGMEAKNEVRERLARESKAWRCESCGRTNSEIMREWWEICKERGVKVEDEMSLEELPDGLRLEARDPGPAARERQPSTETPREPPREPPQGVPLAAAAAAAAAVVKAESHMPTPSTQLSAPAQSFALAGASSHRSPSDHGTGAENPAVADSIAAAALETSVAANNTSSTTYASQELVNRKKTVDDPNPHGRLSPSASSDQPAITDDDLTTTAPNPIQPVGIPNNNAEDLATGTIDKAIGILFVALLIMILKKIFYPAGGGSGGGMEGLYMSGD